MLKATDSKPINSSIAPTTVQKNIEFTTNGGSCKASRLSLHTKLMSPAFPKNPKKTITIIEAATKVIGVFRLGLTCAEENIPGVTSTFFIT